MEEVVVEELDEGDQNQAGIGGRIGSSTSCEVLILAWRLRLFWGGIPPRLRQEWNQKVTGFYLFIYCLCWARPIPIGPIR